MCNEQGKEKLVFQGQGEEKPVSQGQGEEELVCTQEK